MIKITSKKRVLTALSFKEPDRVPRDFSCNPDYEEKLCKYFNIKERKYISNPLVNCVEPEVLKKLNCDLITVAPPYTGPELKKDKDLFGVTKKSFVYNEISYEKYEGHPLKKASLKEVDAYPWPDACWFDYEKVKDLCEEYEDYAIVAGSPGNVDFLYKAGNLYGIEDLYKGLIRKAPVLLKIFEKISDFFYEYNRRIFEAGKGMIDIAFYGDDYGGTYGSLIGEKIYRDIFQPLWKKHYSLACSYGLKVMHHSCGAISNLIPVLKETGAEILDPLEGDAKGMDFELLKEKYHKKMAFHGGICFEKFLSKNKEDLKEEIRKITSIMSPGGGYIMAPTTIVTGEIPLEYILTAYMK